MDTGFFTEEEEHTIVFEDDWKVVIHSEMTAGMQEDYENQILVMELGDDAIEAIQKSAQDGHNPSGPVGSSVAVDTPKISAKDMSARVQMSHLELIRINIIRIIQPDGEFFVPTMEQLRKMKRERYSTILREVNRRNPPLSALGV